MQGRTDHLPGHGSRTKLSWSENSTQTFAEKPLAVRVHCSQEEIPRGGCNDPVSIAGRYSGTGVRMESVVDRLGDSASRPAHLGPSTGWSPSTMQVPYRGYRVRSAAQEGLRVASKTRAVVGTFGGVATVCRGH
jgi:hypothetical protein